MNKPLTVSYGSAVVGYYVDPCDPRTAIDMASVTVESGAARTHQLLTSSQLRELAHMLTVAADQIDCRVNAAKSAGLEFA